MNDTAILQDAQLIWDYMLLLQAVRPADAIFVLCSLDIRVAERAAELYHQGLGKYVVVSGGIGALTQAVFREPEADVFAKILIAQGMPTEHIIIENKSTNTGENIRYSYNLLREKKLFLDSLILVQKPYMERRTYATFMAQWPDKKTKISVTSPQLPFASYPDATNPLDLVINVMVGDLQRIREYPKQGFQIEQNIPGDVWEAYERLVAAGYNQHLIDSPTLISANK